MQNKKRRSNQIDKKLTNLADGATIIPRKPSLAMTRGWFGGISKICFKKNVFNSESCQKITIWLRAKNLMYEQVGSSHRTWVQLSGVNWSMTLFNFPLVEWMSLMLTHLYSRISKHLQIFIPTQIPKPLHTKTSRIRASHQHSLKFGSRWVNWIWKQK